MDKDRETNLNLKKYGQNCDPIIALISSYKEGSLIQGTIRSIYDVAMKIIIFDGKHQEEDIEGPATNLGIYHNAERVYFLHGEWDSETDKRNAMLECAKSRFAIADSGFWILTIDADEILVWGEYLPDWLEALNPGYPGDENIVPIKRTEMQLHPTTKNVWTDLAPSRLVHSSMIKEYLVGCWKIKTPDDLEGFLNHVSPAPMPAVPGEPQIHHRAYLRRNARSKHRSSQGEEAKWIADNVENLCRHPRGGEPTDIPGVYNCVDCHGNIRWKGGSKKGGKWVAVSNL